MPDEPTQQVADASTDATQVAEPAAPAENPALDEMLSRLNELPDDALQRVLGSERVARQIDQAANERARKAIDKKESERRESDRLRQFSDQQRKEAEAAWQLIDELDSEDPAVRYQAEQRALADVKTNARIQKVIQLPEVQSKSIAQAAATIEYQMQQHPFFSDLSQADWQASRDAGLEAITRGDPNSFAEVIAAAAKAKYRNHVPRQEMEQEIEAQVKQRLDHSRSRTHGADITPSAGPPRNGTAAKEMEAILAMREANGFLSKPETTRLSELMRLAMAQT